MLNVLCGDDLCRGLAELQTSQVGTLPGQRWGFLLHSEVMAKFLRNAPFPVLAPPKSFNSFISPLPVFVLD